jgi:hypothetical protein
MSCNTVDSKRIPNNEALDIVRKELQKRHALPEVSDDEIRYFPNYIEVRVKPRYFEDGHEIFFTGNNTMVAYMTPNGQILAMSGQLARSGEELEMWEDVLRTIIEITPNQGLESTSAPPAAGTLETHP